MGFWQGLKGLFFGKRKEDSRNEPKHLNVTYKPKAKAKVLQPVLPKGQRDAAGNAALPGNGVLAR